MDLSTLLDRARKLPKSSNTYIGSAATARPAGGGDHLSRLRLRADLPQLSERLRSQQQHEQHAAEVSAPQRPLGDERAAAAAADTSLSLDAYLSGATERVLSDLVDETLQQTMTEVESSQQRRLAADWTAYKRRLLGAVPDASFAAAVDASFSAGENMQMQKVGTRQLGARRTAMNHVQMVFASGVEKYVDEVVANNDLPPAQQLHEVLADAASSLSDSVGSDMWQQVRCILASGRPATDTVQPAEYRQSVQWRHALIGRALQYLEKNFDAHMESTAERHLSTARRGGVPGGLERAVAYVNVLMPNGNYQGDEDGLRAMQRCPLWPTVFYCLRAGDLPGAVRALQSAADASPLVADLAAALKTLQDTSSTAGAAIATLPADVLTKLRLEYRRKVRHGTDPFKKAVYDVLCQCDQSTEHTAVASKFEDWLWLRLRAAAMSEADSQQQQHQRDAKDKPTLTALQMLITQDYGEQHFVGGTSGASSGTAGALVYWQALWLTGQLERAIDFAWRRATACRDDVLAVLAVHAALAAHGARLLITPADCRVKILTPCGGGTRDQCALNVARMLLVYVTNFEAVDLRQALDYVYLLRDLESPGGENVFVAYVSRVVRETKQYSLVLGDPSGGGGGLLRRYNVRADELCSLVATQCDMAGDHLNAVQLYAMAGKHDEAIKLMNRQLAPLLPQPGVQGGMRAQWVALARQLAHTYSSAAASTERDTFLQLLDLMTFFDLYNAKQFTQALQVIDELKLVPTCDQNAQSCMGKVLMSVLHMLSEMFESVARGTDATMPGRQLPFGHDEASRRAHAAVVFAGAVPHAALLPASAHARMLQMAAKVTG